MPKFTTISEMLKVVNQAAKEAVQMRDYYAKRVVKGTKFLDKNLGDWTKKINLSELDLSSPTVCVLGQLAAKSAITSAGYTIKNEWSDTPGYSDATEALKIYGSDYGFDESSDLQLDHLGQSDTFWILNHLWTAAIRLTKKGLPVTVNGLKAVITI